MNAKSRFQNYTRFLIYVIVVILANVAGVTLFDRIDLTQNQIYSISSASKNAVSTLSEPMTIKVFFSKDLPAPHNSTERYLHDLLEEYAIHGGKYFNYRFYDVSMEQGGAGGEAFENQKTANNYGIYPVQIQNIEKDEVKFQKAYMGMVLIHGDMIEKIPTITTTEGLEYQLTTGMQKLTHKISTMLNLTDNIRIKLILSSSLNTIAPYVQLNALKTLPQDMKEIITKLNDMNYGKLSFEHLDPSQDKEQASAAEKYNVLNMAWPDISEENIPAGNGYAGLIMEYGERVVSVPIVNVVKIPIIGTQYSLVDTETLEDMINENIESLVEINEDIGYLADHGTLQESPEAMMNPMQQSQNPVSVFRNLVSENYTIRDIQLGEKPIPDDFNCLIIAGPKEPFTDYELFQIDQFLMRGKNIAFFLDAFDEKMPPRNQQFYSQGPQYLPLDTGLEKLLAHYGIRINRSYVMDKKCFVQRAQGRTGPQETSLYFAPIIKNEFINNTPVFMKNIKELILVKTSPLELDEKRVQEQGLTATRLLASSQESWNMSGRITLNPMMMQPPPPEEMQSSPLAYLLEGTFTSFFKDKQLPEKPSDNDTKDTPATKEKSAADALQIKDLGSIISEGKPGKIFLTGSSEMLKNTLLDADGMSTNATFILNLVDALNGRDDIAVMRSKEQRFNPLNETGPGVKTFVKAFNIAGLPVLVVAFGLLVWFRRHSRKKNIQIMFQK